MQADQKPFDNAKVREALKYLVDRKKVLDLVYNGYGHMGADHPISPVYPLHCNQETCRSPRESKILWSGMIP
jgi:peptide/nickel transport system substrate-binding protein